MTTKEQGKEIIRKLVETFRDNLQQYSQASYKEAHVRKEFIDKLFVAFGWDVNNEDGLSERYKEVISEDAIKKDSLTTNSKSLIGCFCFTTYFNCIFTNNFFIPFRYSLIIIYIPSKCNK